MKKTVKSATSVVTGNPKTSVAGLVGIGALIASQWLPAEVQTKVQTSIGLLAASGLLAAADPGKKQ